jgi:hypothetical protein
LYLEFCSSGDPRYIEIRKQHYVVHKGAHGQQVHFLVWYHGQIAGIISGGSAVFATEVRDKFFKMHKDNRTKVINGIVDNIVFRLTNHEKNLGSRVLSLWEKAVSRCWESLYGVVVFGFETFIVREGLMRETKISDKTYVVDTVSDGSGIVRRGNMYKAANWQYVGQTKGSTKGHDEVGLTGGREGGKGVFVRKTTPIKDVYCKWSKGYTEPVESVYISSWKAGTIEGTPEEKEVAKQKSRVRKNLLGKKFYLRGRVLENF